MKTVANLIIALDSLAHAEAHGLTSLRLRQYQDFVEERAFYVRLAVYSHARQYTEVR